MHDTSIPRILWLLPNTFLRMKIATILTVFLALGVTLTSCEQKEQAPPSMPTPQVPIIIVQAAQEPVTTNLPGRMEAFLQAEVRARVTGIIQDRCYQEGQNVKEGDLLFKIDPAPLEATVAGCEASLDRAKAILTDAQDKVERYSALVTKGAVSGREQTLALAEQAKSKADYDAAVAALEQAKLDLGYAQVTAPINGRVRRALVTKGALANKNEFTHLTTVEQIDPIYVRFSQPSTQHSKLRRAVLSGEWEGIPLDQIKVKIQLPNGDEYPLPGKILFSDMAVDPNTDTIEMRALFPNPDQELLPGAYVRVVFDKAVRKNVFTIPRDALMRTAQGAFVYVLSKDNTLEMRPVTADTLKEKFWLVTAGLNNGDRVVTGNTSRLQPGMPVIPHEATAAPADAAQQQKPGSH